MEAAAWAGLGFIALHPGEARRFGGTPGLYGLVHNGGDSGRLLLFAGQAEDLAAAACEASRAWGEALRLGMNEVHIRQPVARRVDRLQLLSRIVRHEQPLLNVVEEAHPEPQADPAPRRRCA